LPVPAGILHNGNAKPLLDGKSSAMEMLDEPAA
jgi:hypothetical protein